MSPTTNEPTGEARTIQGEGEVTVYELYNDAAWIETDTIVDLETME